MKDTLYIFNKFKKKIISFFLILSILAPQVIFIPKAYSHSFAYCIQNESSGSVRFWIGGYHANPSTYNTEGGIRITDSDGNVVIDGAVFDTKEDKPSGFVGSFTPPGLTTSDCNYVDTTTDSRLGGADYNESHVQSWQSVVISGLNPGEYGWEMNCSVGNACTMNFEPVENLKSIALGGTGTGTFSLTRNDLGMPTQSTTSVGVQETVVKGQPILLTRQLKQTTSSIFNRINTVRRLSKITSPLENDFDNSNLNFNFQDFEIQKLFENNNLAQFINYLKNYKNYSVGLKKDDIVSDGLLIQKEQLLVAALPEFDSLIYEDGLYSSTDYDNYEQESLKPEIPVNTKKKYKWNLWVGGDVLIGREENTSLSPQNLFTVNNFSAGIDKYISKNSFYGLSFRAATDENKIKSIGAETKSQINGLVIYGSFNLSDNFFVDTSLGFNHLETDSSRTASNELIKSSFDTYQGWSALAINYDVNFENFRITPYVGITGSFSEIRPYDESGGIERIAFNERKIEQYFEEFGFRSSYSYAKNNYVMNPFLEARYVSESQHAKNSNSYFIFDSEIINDILITPETGIESFEVKVGYDLLMSNKVFSISYSRKEDLDDFYEVITDKYQLTYSVKF